MTLSDFHGSEVGSTFDRLVNGSSEMSIARKEAASSESLISYALKKTGEDGS